MRPMLYGPRPGLHSFRLFPLESANQYLPLIRELEVFPGLVRRWTWPRHQADRNIRNRAVSHTGRHDGRECIVAVVGRQIDVRSDRVGRYIGAFDDTKPLGVGSGPECEFGATRRKHMLEVRSVSRNRRYSMCLGRRLTSASLFATPARSSVVRLPQSCYS
jgi:hypothetical protein